MPDYVQHGRRHGVDGSDPIPFPTVDTATIGCHVQASVNPPLTTTAGPVAVTSVDYDPQSMCSGIGATYVTIPQDGLYLLVGTATFQNMPTAGYGSAFFKNLSGAGHYPLGVESSANVSRAGSPQTPATTCASVCPLTSGDQIEFEVVGGNLGGSTIVYADCVYSVTRLFDSP